VAGSLPAWYLSGRQLKTPKATVKAVIKEAHQSITAIFRLIMIGHWSRFMAGPSRASVLPTIKAPVRLP